MHESLGHEDIAYPGQADPEAVGSELHTDTEQQGDVDEEPVRDTGTDSDNPAEVIDEPKTAVDQVEDRFLSVRQRLGLSAFSLAVGPPALVFNTLNPDSPGWVKAVTVGTAAAANFASIALTDGAFREWREHRARQKALRLSNQGSGPGNE